MIFVAVMVIITEKVTFTKGGGSLAILIKVMSIVMVMLFYLNL